MHAWRFVGLQYSHLMSDAVQQIKERLNIVDVVTPYVKLTKAGRSWRGLSPFNKEKTPSFFVSPDRGFYHCFSSGKGGDMFTFVQEMEGVDFTGALKILAEKAGVELSPYEREARDDKEKLYAVLEAASQFFENELGKRADATEYLRNRGLSDTSITAWSLGYAPNEWQALTNYLRHEGYDDEVIEKAGLAKRPERESREQVTGDSNSHPTTTYNLQPTTSRLYDRFRGRIMFPIRDVSGRIIAFSGRDFDGTVPASGEKPAKYINSPETPVFIKSSALYGIDHAKEAMKKHGFAILVEGQMDLLMSHQAGFANTVATSGTALTPGHLGIIKRYAQNVVVAYDGDSAGIAAARRAGLLALASGINVKIAPLPEGVDPADVVKEGADTWKATVRHAVHPIERALVLAQARAGNDEHAFRRSVQAEALPFVVEIENKIDQAHFIAQIAEALHVPESAIQEEVRKLPRETLRSTDTPVAATIPEYRDVLARRQYIEERIYAAAQHAREQKDEATGAAIEKHLTEVSGEARVQELTTLPEARMTELLFELDIIEEARGSLEAEVADLFTELAREKAKREYEKAFTELREAEKRGADPGIITELMSRCNELKRAFMT